jgi:hypothetical protein
MPRPFGGTSVADFEPEGRGSDHRRIFMTDMRCEVCGNSYDKAFELRVAGAVHVFDSFECAIHALAPTCKHCGRRILGHGIESAGVFFCCASCARMDGTPGACDRLA